MATLSSSRTANKRSGFVDSYAESTKKDAFTYTSLEDLLPPPSLRTRHSKNRVLGAESAAQIPLIRDPLVQKGAWLYLQPGLEERNNGCFQFLSANILLKKMVRFFVRLGLIN